MSNKEAIEILVGQRGRKKIAASEKKVTVINYVQAKHKKAFQDAAKIILENLKK